ncbi:hypothetical protein [Chryseobacterium carnipullorum]|uniref:Uncharacterized protein n=1 Tax=Chryseobacterium carnipullorum TaxID=1124835 RepID=A0A376DQR5_CHRCU|nr:hypothetical protein [Chryseobacterium carnipullorum]STC93570.1 Uncharacterised protein [Chryseobacterium carnipullorum]
MKKLLSIFCIILVQSSVYGQKDQYRLLIKTWNFLKYYHPDLASAKKDADSLFLTTVEKVNDQSDANSVIKVLTENLNHKFSGTPVNDQEKDILSANQDFKWYQKNKKISTENKALLKDIYDHRFISDTGGKTKARR